MTESERMWISYENMCRQRAAPQAPQGRGLFSGPVSMAWGGQQAQSPETRSEQWPKMPRPRKKVESKVIEPRMLNA